MLVRAAAGQSGPESSTQNMIQLEVRPVRTSVPPNEPTWVEFLIKNTSNETVELGEAAGAADAFSLPPEIVFGSYGSPAITVQMDDATLPMNSPASQTASGDVRTLRIGPQGVIGTRVDLRSCYRRLSYAGDYRVSWQPFSGRFGTATATVRVEPRRLAVIVTDYGKMTFRLEYDAAPINVANFLDLVTDGFYSNKQVHRIIPGFAIQAGCPNANGSGIRPDGRLVPAEFHSAPFDVGTLAMAHKPDEPNSASCQFFITLARVPDLDGKYTVIGQPADDETRATLTQIGAISTDKKYRPERPLVIRSINLIDETEFARKSASGRKTSP